MKPSHRSPSTLCRLLALLPACLLITAPLSHAQLAPPATPDAATLAKYDANNNGRLDPDEVAVMEADQNKAVPVQTTAPAAPVPEEIIELSPFTVTSEATRGYYAANSMSGTRFNTKLDDLASSISVVTKDQMLDFAMLDMNDVFLYTGNTEGTGTYTSGSYGFGGTTAGSTTGVADRNGSVGDAVSLDPNNANRIRGIGPANTTLGNIQTMGRVPVDPIAIDAIEISRGPNANVFGLGNPSGTVNQVPAAANLTRDRAEAQFRTDSYGGYRSSLDVNRVLKQGELAVRGSAVFQHDGFVRKPSGTNTERLNGMIKFQPFRSTTISASASFYRMNGNRPNYIPPRDNISYWIANGRPTWDPTTQQIHINGVTVGTYTSTTYNGPDYFSATLLGGTRSQMFIDQNGLSYWSAPQAFNNTAALLPGTTVAGPTSGGQAVRFLQTTGIAGATGTAVKPSSQPLWVTSPTVSDKGVYDWSSINLSAPNRIMDRTITTNVQIDQILLNSRTQLLAAQVAFMREDSQRYQRLLLGTANSEGQSGQLEIDPNEKLLDGSPNPYFLRPFMASDKPRTLWAPAKWDTYRAQAAYKLDLTQEKNVLKWLGVQQLTAYDEYKYQINRLYTFREAMLDNKPWLPPGVYRSYQAAPTGTPTNIPLTNGLFRYYVGDNQGNNVDYAPPEFNNNGTYNFVWGRAATNTLPAVWYSEPTKMGLAAADKTGGTFNTKQIVKTAGAVIQSHFLNDTIVTTFGLREDKVYSKFGNQTSNGQVLLAPDGMNVDYNFANGWQSGDYNSNTGVVSGKTTNVQYVVRPLRDLPYLVNLDHEGGAQHFLANALRGLSLNYNHANSFIAAPPAQDLYLNKLPNTTGIDKSYGLGLNLLDGRVVLRVTHYETLQKDIRNGDANTTAQRVIRTDLLLQGATPARFVLQNVAGGTTPSFGPNNNQYGWIKALNPTWTDAQVFTEFSKEIGLSEATITALMNPQPPIAATNDIAARGTEVELNVNVTPSWTVAANFSDTQSFIKNVSSTLQAWIDQRMPIWTTLKDPTINPALEPAQLWWTHNYGGSQTAQANFIAFVQQPYSVIKQLEGQANPQVRRYNYRISTNLRLSGFTETQILRRFNVGGAMRWEDKAAIGFYGKQQPPTTVTDLDVSRPIYDKARSYFDAFVGYKTKLWSDKIGATFQLNVQNIFEGGRLQAVGAYPDGTINTYRIVDPRKFTLTATFNL